MAIKKPRTSVRFGGSGKTHATNKKAHGNYRKRFSFLKWHVRNFPDFQITKKSENAFLYVFK